MAQKHWEENIKKAVYVMKYDMPKYGMSSGILISTPGSGNIARDGTLAMASILHISYTANLYTAITLPGKENRVKKKRQFIKTHQR